MSLTVSVVVCAHRFDRLGLTTKCIQSVLDGDRQPDEIVVVVDNNDDLREELERVVGDAGVRVISNPGSGAAAARSAAVELTEEDVCLFIDDDAWAEKSWLNNLASVFSRTGIAGAGGRVIPEWAEGARKLPPELLWIVGATYRGHPEGEVPITRPIGASMGARADVIRELGGFPTRFGPRGGKKVSSNEELALYTAITERHGPDSVVYVPTSVVHHYVPAARTTWKYIVGRSWSEGTSKADIRSVFRGNVIKYDAQYARSTLVPAIGRYTWNAVHDADWRRLRDAVQCTAALGVTGCGYLSRLVRPSGGTGE